MTRTCLLAAGLFWLAAVAVAAAPPAPAEADVKAAYVLNFIKLVEWPADSFTAPEAPIEVAVLGRGPLTDSLLRLLAQREAQKRRLVVRAVGAAREAATAHVVVLPRGAGESLGDDLGRLRRKGVLTVGEDDDFLELGGGIRFVVEDSKVRFQVDLTATGNADLKLSSSLLSLASVVRDLERGAR